jgi:hypothetical protein
MLVMIVAAPHNASGVGRSPRKTIAARAESKGPVPRASG